ncbi:MAG TPA: hypothetical protein PLF42_09245 [Anaerolineales bacterium]|nr:hypothetical protein [Anaerolineales bacterium]
MTIVLKSKMRRSFIPKQTMSLGELQTAEQLTEELKSIGFIDVSFERLSLGIAAIHVARKPL